MDCSTPGFPVHHQLLELTHTHPQRNSDVIQPSHPLSSPSPPAFNLSQHQGLFQWVSSSHQVAKVLEFQLATSVFPMNIQDWFPLGFTGLISLQSKGLSRVITKYICIILAGLKYIVKIQSLKLLQTDRNTSEKSHIWTKKGTRTRQHFIMK